MRDLLRFLNFRSDFFGMAVVGAVLAVLLILAGLPVPVIFVFIPDRARVRYWLDRQKA